MAMTELEACELLQDIEVSLIGYQHEFDRAGAYGRARRVFLEAGNDARAQECEYEELVFSVNGTDSAKPGERFKPRFVYHDGQAFPDLPDGIQSYLGAPQENKESDPLS